jgi:hypothetical protein
MNLSISDDELCAECLTKRNEALGHSSTGTLTVKIGGSPYQAPSLPPREIACRQCAMRPQVGKEV